ncbi:anhydro-N-acetylmuramic acid kinase [soil metagenome]
MPELYIGLMSGTSLDGVDGVLADFSSSPMQVLAHVALPFDDDLKTELLALNTPGADELHRAALAANALVRVYARAVTQLLEQSGVSAKQVRAIGAHGQTVRHRPQEFDGTGYTLQLNSPALLAELTRIDVVADFRSRDVAAGGQGAPLTPLFHAGVFATPGFDAFVLNLGGISNLSVLVQDGGIVGFDCGPGNSLMDHWCQQHTGKPYDAEGTWAASGTVNAQLLADLLDVPYFALPAPKSTGRDLFNPVWLAHKLTPFARLAPVDVQATLAEFTASTCATSVKEYAGAAGSASAAGALIVCGGGAFNTHLLARLQALLPGFSVDSSLAHGLAPLEVEAAAFAWLARQCVRGDAAGRSSVTGAKGARVLGALYPR